MLIFKLQKNTFRAYKGLWKRLLCFVFRTSVLAQSSGIPLLHRFTNAQLFHLKQVMDLAEELLSVQRLSRSNALPTEGEGIEEVVYKLDRACLPLCIALLDHTLQSDHFKSVVLSFLAFLGIDKSPSSLSH